MRPGGLLRLLLAMNVVGVLVAGPAAAAEGKPQVLFRFDEQVTESSGLLDLGDRVLTVNDSGDDAVVYVIAPDTGATVGRTTYADEVTDVEAMALGPDGDVWIGDIGDNPGSRTRVTVHRIPPPTDGDRRVDATTYDLTYRGGARDAEALLISPQGRLYVVSKGLFGGQVWEAPEQLSEDGPNLLTPVGDAGGLVTDGAWFPDGRHVVLRDYSHADVYDASVQPWRRVDQLDIPDLQQGEGIAVRPDGDLLVSSEGPRQPVVEVPLPQRLRDDLAPGGSARPAGDEAVAGEELPPDPGLTALLEGRDLRVTAAVVVGLALLVLLTHRLLRSPR